jgi:hypothetical protein
LRVQTIKIELRFTGVPIHCVKFAPLRKLRSSEAGQSPIYYLFESESIKPVFSGSGKEHYPDIHDIRPCGAGDEQVTHGPKEIV